MLKFMILIKPILLTALICLTALAGGTVSALYMLDHFSGFDRLTIDQWQATPLYGSADADPYARAQRIRMTILPLGTAEGQRFTLDHDDKGKPLNPQCSYILHGKTPSARFWTLHASDRDHRPLPSTGLLPQSLYSGGIWYQDDAVFRITVSANAQPANWLAVRTHAPYQLVLTLYDTDLGTSIG
jgi:hypothetical protein